MSPLSDIASPTSCWDRDGGRRWASSPFSPFPARSLPFALFSNWNCPVPVQHSTHQQSPWSEPHHNQGSNKARRRRRIIRAISHLDITSPTCRVLVHERSILKRWVAWFGSVRSFLVPLPFLQSHHRTTNPAEEWMRLLSFSGGFDH